MIKFIITPVIGGIIGYFTNWLAIKMLFLPHEEKYFFGIKIPFTPGLIPKDRLKLSKKIGAVTGNYLLTGEILASSLKSPAVNEKISDFLNSLKGYTIDELLLTALKENRDSFVLCVETQLESICINLLDNEEFISKFTDFIDRGIVNFSEKKLGDYIKKQDEEKLKQYFSENIPVFANNIIEYLDGHKDLDDSLRELTAKLVSENIGKLAGLFINTDKVYDNIKKSITEYFDDDENRILFAIKINSFLNRLLNYDLKTLIERIKPITENNEVNRHLKASVRKYYEEGIKPELIKYIKSAVHKIISYVMRQKTDGFTDRISSSDKNYTELIKENIIGKISDIIISALDISGIVENQINSFEMRTAEEIIISVAKKELNAITYLGGVLGFIIGFIPLIFEYLGVLGNR